jgi:hypothetical protein
VGDEKAGVHRIVTGNPHVIDVEVAFGVEANSGEGPATRRIDFVTLYPSADGGELTFYEAKLFANKDIRANGDNPPPVIGQIEGYRQLLAKHREDLLWSYRAVCGNLLALEGVRERYAASHGLLSRIADGDATLHMSDAVRLVVFGFDADQRNGKVWASHRQKLKAALGERLLLRGSPQGWTLPFAL